MTVAYPMTGNQYQPTRVGHGAVPPPCLLVFIIRSSRLGQPAEWLYTIRGASVSRHLFQPIDCKQSHFRLMILSMKVQLTNPDRRFELKGPKRVKDLLRDLDLLAEANLVIRGDELVTEDEMLKDSDEVEIRSVISGGAQTLSERGQEHVMR